MKHIRHHIVAASDLRPHGLALSRPPSRARPYIEALAGLLVIFGWAWLAWNLLP